MPCFMYNSEYVTSVYVIQYFLSQHEVNDMLRWEKILFLPSFPSHSLSLSVLTKSSSREDFWTDEVSLIKCLRAFPCNRVDWASEEITEAGERKAVREGERDRDGSHIYFPSLIA